jgi:hypothetical protein
MFWRSVVASAYVALAVVVGVAYGGQGLVVLSYFYVWAGAWVVFFFVWGRVAQDAGRWNVDRIDPERR